MHDLNSEGNLILMFWISSSGTRKPETELSPKGNLVHSQPWEINIRQTRGRKKKKKCNSKSKLFISVAPESSALTQDLVNWLLPETAPRRPGPRSCRAERRELADSHVSEREICRKTNTEFAHFPPLGPIIARLVWQIMQLLPQLNKLVFIFDIPRAPGDCFVYI